MSFKFRWTASNNGESGLKKKSQKTVSDFSDFGLKKKDPVKKKRYQKPYQI